MINISPLVNQKVDDGWQRTAWTNRDIASSCPPFLCNSCFSDSLENINLFSSVSTLHVEAFSLHKVCLSQNKCIMTSAQRSPGP